MSSKVGKNNSEKLVFTDRLVLFLIHLSNSAIAYTCAYGDNNFLIHFINIFMHNVM